VLFSIVLFSDIQLPNPLRKSALYLSKIPCSLYLYQNLLIAVAVLGFTHFEIQCDWASPLWACACAFGGTLASAELLYRWIERLGILLRRHLALHKNQDRVPGDPLATHPPDSNNTTASTAFGKGIRQKAENHKS